jgi:hypothetical protein
MMRFGAARFGAATSPIPADELAPAAPLDAADRVAAWRPAPDASFIDPDAPGLATALREAIGRESAAWFAADPIALARALREPRYIGALIDALLADADHLPHPDRVVALAEVVSGQPPWEIHPEQLLDDGYPWSRLREDVIKLLGRVGRLGRLSAGADGRAWAIIASAVRDRGDRRASCGDADLEPLMGATQRPSMRALEAALQFGRGSPEAPDPRLLDLIDGALALPRVDGLHARAILAIQLPWLCAAAPEWFAARADRIFGGAAPDGLGDATLDLYLEYGGVDPRLLADHRDAIVAALGRDQREHAVQHLMNGMMLEVDGYAPDVLAPRIAAAGPDAVADTAFWLGTAFSGVEDADLTPVTTLWRALVDLELSPGAYAGFGWLAVNELLEQGDWLDLAVATVAAACGNLAEPDRVAERAARSPGDDRAARIVAGLLTGDPQPWELQRIGAAGLELLPTVGAHSADELRERLLQRGFYSAR